MSKFSEAIETLRKQHDMSQQEFADKVGVSRSAVSMWEIEGREPKYETLEAIADTFNVDMNYLIGKTKKAPSEDEAEEFERAVNLLFSEHPENLSRLLDALAADPEKTKAKFDLFLATL